MDVKILLGDVLDIACGNRVLLPPTTGPVLAASPRGFLCSLPRMLFGSFVCLLIVPNIIRCFAFLFSTASGTSYVSPYALLAKENPYNTFMQAYVP